MWDGADTWGVGLDSRKSVLLKNPGDVYGVLKGTIDTSTLAVGTYTVQLDAVSAGFWLRNRLEPAPVRGFLDESDGGESQGRDDHVHRGRQFFRQSGADGGLHREPDRRSSAAAVSFDGSTSSDPDGDALTYAWTFGDGQTGTGATASHTYTTAGSYDATLTVSDGKGGSNSKTATIAVSAVNNKVPTAVVTANPPGSVPLTVNFDASASTDPDGDTLSYAWTFGDNQTGTGATVSHTYTTAKTYSASVKVSDSKGGSDTKAIEITVTSAPTAAVTATPTSGVAPLMVIFDGNGSSDPNGYPLFYSWNFGDGDTSSGAATSHQYAAAGTYIATLTVNNGQGGTGMASTTITVQANGAPTAVVSTNPNPASGMAPLRVTFDGGGSSDPNTDSLTYTWSFDDDTTASGKVVSHTYVASGPHIVTLTVNDGHSGAGIAQVQVNVTSTPSVGNNPPTVVASATPTSGNVPLTVTFDGSQTTDPDGDALITYVWDFGNGLANAGAKRSYTYLTPGRYTASLSVTDAQSAVGIGIVEVFVNGSPVAAATATPSSGLAPLTTVLDATGSSDPNGDAMSYHWDFGDGQTDTGKTLAHTYAAGGSYKAKVTVRDGNGGEGTREVVVVVNAAPGGRRRHARRRQRPADSGIREYGHHGCRRRRGYLYVGVRRRRDGDRRHGISRVQDQREVRRQTDRQGLPQRDKHQDLYDRRERVAGALRICRSVDRYGVADCQLQRGEFHRS